MDAKRPPVRLDRFDRRSCARHDLVLPCEIEVCGQNHKPHIGISTDIGDRGVRLRLPAKVPTGSDVKITMCLYHQMFEFFAQVAWCRDIEQDQFEIGLNYLDETDSFRAKISEQIAAIRDLLDSRRGERDDYSIDEACREWIERNRDDFPDHLNMPMQAIG